ncbi:MAG: DUF58 domain-containing protein [Syntrophorhabdaceae bacterium]|nr:DUF58 domain-containing protein [Syntrophorhabdaceae bacterium]
MDTIVPRRVSSLFTVPMMLGIVGLILVIGLLNSQRDIIILSVMLFASISGLKTWAHLSDYNVNYEIHPHRTRVFAGEGISVDLLVLNRKAMPVSIEIVIPLRKEGSNSEISNKGNSSLLWYQECRFTWSFPLEKRGIYKLGPIKSSTGDLLSFFQREKSIKDGVEIVAYPRIIPLILFPAKGKEFFGIPGESNPVKDPVYILGTRDYQQERPARFIHWKASAKKNHLQEKIFDSTTHEKLLIIVDVDKFSEVNDGDVFDSTLEVVASMAVLFERRGLPTGLMTNGEIENYPSYVPISRGFNQISAILEALARLKMKRGIPFQELLEKWGYSMGRATFILFTMEENDNSEMLKRFSRDSSSKLYVLTLRDILSLRREANR